MLEPAIAATSTQRWAARVHGADAATPWRITASSHGRRKATVIGYGFNANASILASGARPAGRRGIGRCEPRAASR